MYSRTVVFALYLYYRIVIDEELIFKISSRMNNMFVDERARAQNANVAFILLKIDVHRTKSEHKSDILASQMSVVLP